MSVKVFQVDEVIQRGVATSSSTRSLMRLLLMEI